MEHNEVDITFTVKTSEANGRKLIKNVDTGETRWLSQVSSKQVPPEEMKPVVKKEPVVKKKPRKPSMQD